MFVTSHNLGQLKTRFVEIREGLISLIEPWFRNLILSILKVVNFHYNCRLLRTITPRCDLAPCAENRDK